MRLRPFSPNRTLLNRDDVTLPEFLWGAGGLHQLALCILGFVVALLTMAPIELHRRLVDDVIMAKDLNLLFGLGTAYLILILVKGAAKYSFQVYQGWLTESTALLLRQELVEHYEARRGAGESVGDGSAVTVIGTETDKLAGFVGEALSQVVFNLGMILVVGVYMLSEQWLIGVVTIAILLPQVFVVPLIQRRINRLIEKRLALLRDLGEDVSALCGERHAPADRALGVRAKDIYWNRLKIFFWKFLAKAFVNLMNNLAPAALLVFGGYMVIEGETTLGVLVAFLSGLERVADPLRDLVNHYREMAQGRVQFAKLRDWTL